VKEFLTSDRLADIKADISCFHIRLEPAHTVIAQACLAILLQSDNNDGAESTSPLSGYAAQHWVDHAHFGNVSLRVEDGMRRLFDPAKPYFTAWLNSYDPDNEWTSFLRDDSDSIFVFARESKFTSLGEDDAPLCLYYAVLCGFHNLTKYLITKYPQHVNATVGRNKSPLAAALRNRHLQVAELLHQYGAVGPIRHNGRTLLHAASADGLVDVTQWLLNTGADANAQERNHRTPLSYAAANGRLEIVRVLLGHGADVNAADNRTSLHEAFSGGHVDVVRLLIKHGADVHARDQSQSTPLHLASSEGGAETARLLIEHGADVNAQRMRWEP
jgi:ankyrin repeat protein